MKLLEEHPPAEYLQTHEGWVYAYSSWNKKLGRYVRQREKAALATCKVCGEPFPYRTRMRKPLCCSRKCIATSQESNSGRFQGLPNGTTRQWVGGYIVVKTGEGSLNGGNWEFEHRYVMRTSLGRPLADDEVVHHINGDRTDNRLENLQLLKRGSHASGQAHVCLDCGSHNVGPAPFK